MGRTEQMLLDGGWVPPNRPKTFARNPPSTLPYHKKLRMFQSSADNGRRASRLLVQEHELRCRRNYWCKDGADGIFCSILALWGLDLVSNLSKTARAPRASEFTCAWYLVCV